MLRRKKVAEMEAFQAQIAERQAEADKAAAEQEQARRATPKTMPAPRKKSPAPGENITDHSITFEVSDDFLSALLDPDTVEPTDPVLDEE